MLSMACLLGFIMLIGGPMTSCMTSQVEGSIVGGSFRPIGDQLYESVWFNYEGHSPNPNKRTTLMKKILNQLWAKVN